ncbi:cadherin-4-like isoform X1 [Clarias magur]|uniref:Cadherin-4-like isoform X1 n=1 Tax=Clarias magur TaxID=1594786 RepID=A0A8J4U2L5_CLAMG|nr:cadherin-4-like isoform X1 [Clarias magur]
MIVNFEACHRNERITFESSDPKFSVRPDGTLYAERDLTDLSEPVRLVLTARGNKHVRIWKTIVNLVIIRHPRSNLNQVRLRVGGGRGGSRKEFHLGDISK